MIVCYIHIVVPSSIVITKGFIQLLIGTDAGVVGPIAKHQVKFREPQRGGGERIVGARGVKDIRKTQSTEATKQSS